MRTHCSFVPRQKTLSRSRAVFFYIAMAAQQEKTFIMIKPDGVQRRLVGEIIKRFEQRGYQLVAMKMIKPANELVREHYIELKDKPFYDKLVKYILSAPVVAMVWQGVDVVKQARKMLGATNPLASDVGTIRGDFAIHTGRNIIHGSDSVQSANREIALWFKGESSAVEWKTSDSEWVYE